MKIYTALNVSGAGSVSDEDLTFVGVFTTSEAAKAALEELSDWTWAADEEALDWKVDGGGFYAQTESASYMFLVLASSLDERVEETIHI